jgi:hypothetical protein
VAAARQENGRCQNRVLAEGTRPNRGHAIQL